LLEAAGLRIVEGGANGGPLVAVDYLLWHALRQGRRKGRWLTVALAGLLKLAAQPLAWVDDEVDQAEFATSFHYLAVRRS
jgi:hypothetical protein